MIPLRQARMLRLSIKVHMGFHQNSLEITID